MTVDERLRVASRRVRDYLAAEHDEHYPLSVVERAVCKWFALEVEKVLEESTEVLTTPRFREAHEFQAELARITRENERQASEYFYPVNGEPVNPSLVIICERKEDVHP